MTDPREVAPPATWHCPVVVPAKTVLTPSAAMLRAQNQHDGGELPPPKPRRAYPWKPADNARLASLIAAGYCWAEIGAIMGRTPDSCRVHSYKLPKPAARPTLRARLRAAWLAFWRG